MTGFLCFLTSGPIDIILWKKGTRVGRPSKPNFVPIEWLDLDDLIRFDVTMSVSSFMLISPKRLCRKQIYIKFVRCLLDVI